MLIFLKDNSKFWVVGYPRCFLLGNLEAKGIYFDGSTKELPFNAKEEFCFLRS
jgi:hypothetical protein